jgi:transcription elongation factor GreB
LGDHTKVWFGAWVTLENEDGDEHEWRIVGPDEFDVNQKKISCDSPMGRALLGKVIDSDIPLETPEGRINWRLVRIDYR